MKKASLPPLVRRSILFCLAGLIVSLIMAPMPAQAQTQATVSINAGGSVTVDSFTMTTP